MKFKISIMLWFFLSKALLNSGFMDTALVLSFIRTKHLKDNVILTCDAKRGLVRLQKNLLSNGNMLFLVKNFENLNVLDNLVANYRRVGVILNGDCNKAEKFLIRCNNYKVFDSKHFWLVLYNSSDYLHLFYNVSLNIDADVKIAYPAKMGKDYVIDDIYNPASERGGTLRHSNIGSYSSTAGYHLNETTNKYVTRRNLTGVKFNVLAVLNEPYEEPVLDYLKSNDKNIHVDTLGRFHAKLLYYCEQYYNFSIKLIGVTNSWGYYQPDGTMDGLVGALERHQVDFGLSPLVAKVERAKFISFGKGTWPLRMAFVLRNPNSKKSYEIFTKPFSFWVWMCVTAAAIFALLALKCSHRLDRKVAKTKLCVDSSWSLSALGVFGAFCQQGINAVPHCLSGKISGLFLLWLGVMTYQFYSATLVSYLLNVPVTVLTTVQGILESNFEVGYENVKYAKSILQQRNDSLAKEVYRRVSAKNGSGFLRREKGLNLVKKGHYAYHVELITGYPFINQHFDVKMICELREIPLFPNMFMYSGYQKWSPYKDVIDVCLQRFEEYGIATRELHFWHPIKPQCVRTPSMLVINTSLEDFYPALVIWFLGVIVSLEVLLIEILWIRREKRREKQFEFTQ